MTAVAALYVDPRGPYPALLGPELCWDEERDARRYDGPHPVVAHPPCGPWGRLRHLYRGSEHDCALRAVEQVRRWGGVLEHPAGSLLWQECFHDRWDNCPLPEPWQYDPFGYTIQIDQVEWGHVARKRTWLYVVGIPAVEIQRWVDARPFPGREPTHWVSGGGAGRGRVPPGIKVCSAQQRRRTPPAFAGALITLAGMSTRGAE